MPGLFLRIGFQKGCIPARLEGQELLLEKNGESYFPPLAFGCLAGALILIANVKSLSSKEKSRPSLDTGFIENLDPRKIYLSSPENERPDNALPELLPLEKAEPETRPQP